MLHSIYASEQGQMLMIVDAFVLLVILGSGFIYFPPKRSLLRCGLFVLCWCAIVVSTVAAQQITVSIHP